jgi:hypothetical protein
MNITGNPMNRFAGGKDESEPCFVCSKTKRPGSSRPEAYSYRQPSPTPQPSSATVAAVAVASVSVFVIVLSVLSAVDPRSFITLGPVQTQDTICRGAVGCLGE